MQLLALALFALLGLQAPAPTPPSPGPVAPPAKTVQAPAPTPYDERADARADIAAALARASAENRRVLLQWGGNGCGGCIKLHQLYKSDKQIAKKLQYEYDVVYVDVGRLDKHQDLALQYGADVKSGVPYLTVLDGAGKVLANQETGRFEQDGAYDPAKVLEFLTAHQATYWKAGELLAAAKASAAKQEKRVLLTFGAPWCPWCHKLEDWMATPTPAALLAKDFVIRKIDVDRTIGGKALHLEYQPQGGGIPWFCVLDAEGALLGNSNDAAGANIGCPYKDEEIATFARLLGKVSKNLTAEDIAQLSRSLVEMREQDERAAAAKKEKKAS